MPELSGLTIANIPCKPKVAGVKKVWAVDCTKMDIVVTQGTLKAEVSDYTIENLDDLVQMEFTKNKTAFLNMTQSAKNSSVDYTLQIPYEAITPEILYVLNTMRTTCCFGLVVELNSGQIIVLGWDYDWDTDTITTIDDPIQLKGSVASGTGNNDSELTTFEFVGQGKSFPLTTSLVAADFDDTTGHD